ncbi:ABC transporter permease [Rhodobacteraceae bacterium NNCM2]|nr:ABC transporter permease [Coraliihabitans acroporae]
MEAFLISVLIAATPLLLAATGELVAERSGVLNLGVEGMMLIGAVSAFAVAYSTGEPVLAVLAGAGAGLAMAGLFAFIALFCMANQMATGLALTIFGIGASGLIGQGFVGETIEPLAQLDVQSTMAGRILLSHDILVYLAIALCLGTGLFLSRTRWGLMLRAVGDNHDAAHALGLAVRPIRVAAVLFGGAMAGLGGAYLSLAYTPMWGEGMTAGRGWIALALVVFATWRAERVLLGAWFFAAISQLQFYGQDWGIALPSQFLAMAPYLATIIALVLISRDETLTRSHAPACIGRPFRAER